MNAIQRHNSQVCLMQCNTNYTGSLENFKYCNLNVLQNFKELYPGATLGLSDHTPHATVLGALALGATVLRNTSPTTTTARARTTRSPEPPFVVRDGREGRALAGAWGRSEDNRG